MLSTKVRVCWYELHAKLLYSEQEIPFFPDAWGGKGQRKLNRRGQSGIDPPLMTSHLRALAWKLIRPAEGITWCEKNRKLEKQILCLSSRHAMVGHRWTNVGLMFS